MSNNSSEVSQCNEGVSVAQYLLIRLKQLGLDKVFQVPGDYVQEFMDALEGFDGIDAVGDINELGAGYAADGYARLKGIGAISVQYGVGTFSALNAVAGSYVERNPVVVITASPSTKDRKITQQKGVLFHHSTGNLKTDANVYSNITVATEVISAPHIAPAQIDKALIAAITHRRPVYIEAYQNVWGERCASPESVLEAEHVGDNKQALEAALTSAMQVLSEAKRPIILLGIEVARFELEESVLELINNSGIPFSTTTLAKTVLDENEPGFIGTYAGPASIPETNTFVEGADCVVALGCIFTDDYLAMMANQYEQMIQVDLEQTRIGSSLYSGVSLRGFIDGLNEASLISELYPRNDILLPLLPPTKTLDDSLLDQAMSYTTFFDIFSAYFHEEQRFNGIELILGESSSLYTASNLLGLPKDGFIANAAWGSLGHETGAAAGVALASDKRPIVVAGDGGFMMMCQALSTISRNHLNAVIFVMSNKVYAIEQAFVNINAFDDEDFAEFDKLPVWGYLGLAEAYGMPGFVVSNGRELVEALEYLQINPEGSALIEVKIPEKDLAPQIKRLAEA